MTVVPPELLRRDVTAAAERPIYSPKVTSPVLMTRAVRPGAAWKLQQRFMPERRGIVHVTGFNLIAVIECLLSSDRLTPEKVDEIVAGCSLQMKRVSVEKESSEDVEDDEGGFFS